MELTEQRDVGDVAVYGFLRATNVPKARQESLLGVLGEYCRRHELRLAGTFTERGPRCSAAFTGLLDVLALSGAYGVVVPTLAHLGARPVAAERRKRLIGVGAHLFLVRGGRREPLVCAETQTTPLSAAVGHR